MDVNLTVTSELLTTLATSAVVSAIVGGLVTFLSQSRLLSRKAQLDYELDAKRRLYQAIGPLRLQLLLASRDVVRRFQQHHEHQWNMSTDGYYVKSCVYRLLAPLAIGQLIERQMSVVDFTVDRDAISLLSFITSAERMLTGGEVVLDHPDVDWSNQSQHLFRDNLRAAANELIESKDGRLITFAEFDESCVLDERSKLKPLASIFGKCNSSLTENSVFWARIVGYCFACSEHLNSPSADSLGFSKRPIPIDSMLKASNDEHFVTRVADFKRILQETLAEGF